MGRRSQIPIQTLVEMCKKALGCNEGLIAYWSNTGGLTAYRLFKQIRDLCRSGFLDSEEYQCVDKGDAIEFQPVRAREKPATEEDLKRLLAARPEGEE